MMALLVFHVFHHFFEPLCVSDQLFHAVVDAHAGVLFLLQLAAGIIHLKPFITKRFRNTIILLQTKSKYVLYNFCSSI